MDWSNILQYSAIVVAIASVAGVRLQQSTIQALKDNNDALEKSVTILKEETSACLASHVVNDRKITALEAKLKTYDDLALVPKEFIERHGQTQVQIVGILQQIQENQPNKRKVAKAVRQVKTDLEQSRS